MSTTTQIPRFLIESVIVVGFIVLMLLLLVMEQTATEVIGLLGLFGMAGLRLMPSLNRLLTGATDLRQRAAYIDNLHTDLIDGLVDRDQTEDDPDLPAMPFERELRLESVSYLYEGTTEKALHDIRLSITKGETIGVVGPSGAGKSTLIDMILGFLRPQAGKILLDGRDIFEDLRGWQRQIGCRSSTDGINWTACPGNPQMTPRPSFAPFEGNELENPNPIYHDGLWLMAFTGFGGPQGTHFRLGLAASFDGQNWEEAFKGD